MNGWLLQRLFDPNPVKEDDKSHDTQTNGRKRFSYKGHIDNFLLLLPADAPSWTPHPLYIRSATHCDLVTLFWPI